MEEKKDHKREQESPTNNMPNSIFLDLSLSRKDDHDRAPSIPELHLIDGLELDSSEKLNSDQTPQGAESTEHRVFSCNYCQRKFYSSQALGGHQNAHKRERTLAKRVNSHSNRYSSISSLPLHGSFHERSLGIQAHSMILKPIWTSRQAFDHHQPAIGRLVHQETGIPHIGIGPIAATNARAPRFDTFRRFSSSPASDGIKGGMLWWGGMSHMKSKPEEVHNKLDLSLKL